MEFGGTEIAVSCYKQHDGDKLLDAKVCRIIILLHFFVIMLHHSICLPYHAFSLPSCISMSYLFRPDFFSSVFVFILSESPSRRHPFLFLPTSIFLLIP